MTQTIEQPPAFEGMTRNVDCIHVDCVGGECRYRPEPPEIGPQLPTQIRDCDGGLWTRHGGLLFYKRRDRADGSHYALVTWSELCRCSSPFRDSEFPFHGPWTVRLAEFFGWPQLFTE